MLDAHFFPRIFLDTRLEGQLWLSSHTLFIALLSFILSSNDTPVVAMKFRNTERPNYALSFLKILFIYCVILGMQSDTSCMYRPENSFQDLVLSFYDADPGTQALYQALLALLYCFKVVWLSLHSYMKF